MADVHVLLSIARVATAALAANISILALRAYFRSRRRSILALSAGAGLLAAGYFAEGLLVELGNWSLHDATVLESVTTLVAVGVLVASLYLKNPPSSRAAESLGKGSPGSLP